MHDFVHEATHEFLHLDGKILQTVKLLVAKPGELTREFLAGRRTRYISPVRVYLTFSLLFFTLAAILPRTGDSGVKVSKTGLRGDTELERKIAAGLTRAQKDPTLLRNAVLHDLPKIMFVLMPVFGLLTWAFYWRQQRFYIPHLYYAVHFHAFVFLVMSAYVLIQRIGVPKPFAAVLILTNVPYHYIALRRVFGGSRLMTFAKGTTILILYWLIAAVSLAMVAFWVVLHL